MLAAQYGREEIVNLLLESESSDCGVTLTDKVPSF